jgi:alanine racemase
MERIWPDRIEAELGKAPPGTTGVLFVNLGALRRNYRTLRNAAPGAGTAAVVKAGAYGLGIDPVVSALRNEGCQTFFVATPGEAAALAGLPGTTVYVLDGFLKGAEAIFRDGKVRPVLNSLAEAEEWLRLCESLNRRQPAAIQIDTGMNRLGLSPEEIRVLLQTPQALAAMDLQLVISHLACADQPASPKNEEQRARFDAMASHFAGIPKSLANSAGVFLGQTFHYDLTRPGIALYGGRPAAGMPNALEPVVSLYGRIAQVRWAERGETAGYGAAQTLGRRTRIATVTAGYADGFSRALSSSDQRHGPPAYLGAHRLPLLGRVSMDLTTYDATDIPDAFVQRGGFVETLGKRVTVDDLASAAGTISYEVLTSLGHRYHRVYLDDES